MCKLPEYQADILLVEDYPAGMMISTMIIEHLGYTVEGASSGIEAVEKVRARSTPYMAILMDINMHEMNGLEATRIIRHLEKTKGYFNTIIAVTAHALAGDRERFLESGMNDYISKPIHPDILAQKLEALSKVYAVS